MKIEKFININWYMERKPYQISSETDVFYLKICRDLFKIIDTLTSEYEDVYMDEEDCREMAYIFTAYFEDQATEIGFWKSLTELHKKQFGKRLPFFDASILQQQEEDWGDILPADIHYLGYISYLNILTNTEDDPIILFNTLFFIELTEKVFNYLEKNEEVLIPDFYESFLLPESDYIDFKKQLDWFTYQSYLTGMEFSHKLDDFMLKLVDGETDPSLMQPLLYTERDRLMFEVPSRLTAIFPADILAGAMHCNEEKKQEIRNLKWRPHGLFHIRFETATHYRFLHTSTDEEFDVLKNSLNNPIDCIKNEYWITTLADWNNDYNVSGLCSVSPYKGEKIYHYNLKMQHRFQKHYGKYREHIEETALKYRNEAQRFLGNDLIVFDTGYQLQEKLNEFNQWYFDVVADKSGLPKGSKPVMFDLPQEIVNQAGVALFIPPADGLQFITNHQLILDLLQTKEVDVVTVEQRGSLLTMLSDDTVGPDYWFYLKKNFPIPNLSLFLKCPVDNEMDFDALLRIYRPEDFSPLKLPRFSTFTSEKISHETARKIFSKEKVRGKIIFKRMVLKNKVKNQNIAF
ncbi:MAG: DUF3843 family protein [Chitinophagaceae bacterium]